MYASILHFDIPLNLVFDCDKAANILLDAVNSKDTYWIGCLCFVTLHNTWKIWKLFFHDVIFSSNAYHYPRQWYGKKQRDHSMFYLQEICLKVCYLVDGVERHHNQFSLHSSFTFDWTALHNIPFSYKWLSFIFPA